MKPNLKLRSFAALVTLLTSFALTGCGTTLSARKVSQFPSVNIYQPPVLVLPSGLSVQTEMGIYQPQTREIWHSQARFREMELQLQDLAAALAQERARK